MLRWPRRAAGRARGAGGAVTGPGERVTLADGWRLSGLTCLEVWLRYFAVGGSSTAAEVGAYIIGVLQPGWYEYDMIAVAINEALIDKGLRSAVAYSDEKPGGFSSRAAADAG
jgi:hypothetical protein